MNIRRVFVVAILAACLAAAALWFYSNFERRTESEWIGFQGKARYDRWLAAERLLQRMGAKAAAVRSLPELGSLPASATLLLPRGRQALSPQLRQSLLDWVQQGGRLIVEAEIPNLPDPLLGALGVRRKLIRTADTPKKDEDDSGRLAPIEVALPPELAPVTVGMNPHIDLKANGALAQFGNGEANTMLLLQAGRGHALVLNDFEALSNHSIGEYDHAEFLWRIVQVDQGAPSVFFFYDPRKLSLFEWLRAHAWSAVAGAAVLLLIWLWRAVPRFGPTAPDPERTRRRLLDHLRASGRFLWAHDGAQVLVDAAREACLRRIVRVHPELLAASDAEREARMTELLGLDAAQSRILFSQKAPAGMLDFLHTIRLYQTVHERLALKRRGAGHTKGT